MTTRPKPYRRSDLFALLGGALVTLAWLAVLTFYGGKALSLW